MNTQITYKIHRWRIVAFIFIGMSILMGVYLFQTVHKQYILNVSGIEQRKVELLSFTELFIDNVLVNEGEVNFDTRLELENSVRSLNDKEVLAKWKEFVNSTSETEAQNSVASLLQILISKVNNL